jgi:TP901 family phage tail tape measure protein
VAIGGLNIGDLLLTLLADGSMLKADIERQGLAAADAAGPKIGSSLGASIAAGLTKNGALIATIGKSLTKNLTVPIVAAGAIVTDVGLKFDTTLRQIVALTDITQAEIGGIRKQLLDLATVVGKSPTELGQAFYFLASGGFNAKESMDILTVSAKAAASGLGDTQDVAKVLGASINAFGKENLTAKDAADQLIRAIKDGTAEAPDFAGALGDVVGSAGLLGATFADTTGALAAMTLKGINADEAATSLNQIFRSLIKVTPQADKAFASVGLTAAGLKDELKQQGLIAVLQTLETAFKGNDEAAAKAFGNVRALRGVLALIGGDEGKSAARILKDVASGTTDLNSAFEQTDGPQRKINQALARLQVTMIKLGGDVLPVVVQLLNAFTRIVEKVSNAFEALPQPTRKFIIEMLALTAALGPVVLVAGKVIGAFGGMFKAINFLAKSRVAGKLADVLISPLIDGVSGLASKITAPLSKALGSAIEQIAATSVVSNATSSLGQFLGSTLGKAASVAFAAFLWVEVVNTYNQIKASLAAQNAGIDKEISQATAEQTTAQLEQTKAVVEKGLSDLSGVWDAGIFTTDARKRLEANLAEVNAELARRAAGFGPSIAGGIQDGQPVVNAALGQLIGPEAVANAVNGGPVDTSGGPPSAGKLSAAAYAAGKNIPDSIASGILKDQNKPVDALAILKDVMRRALTPAARIGRDIGILTSTLLARGLKDKRKVVSDEAKRVRAVAEKDLAQLILDGGQVGKKAADELAKKLHDKNPKVRAAARRVKAIVDSELQGTIKPAGDAGSAAGNAFITGLEKSVSRAMNLGITIRANEKGNRKQGKAIGGPVVAGVPVLVNEATPNSEYFVPSVSGRVVTRAQAAEAIAASSGMGGDTINIPVNVQGALPVRTARDIANEVKRHMELGLPPQRTYTAQYPRREATRP